jgi:flavin reductase (DIM6/NTAB) family NADH-FMN oxidoreductase RutF
VGGIACPEPVSGNNPGPRLDRDGVAIATSGDYYQISKFGYHHIVNPAAMAVMKAGSQTVGSVSVMATSCALADGLATAAMTCDTAGAAAQLLKRVVESAHGKVLGYCVVGRGADKKSQVLMSSFFKAAHSDMDTSRSTSRLTPTSTTDESALWRNHPALEQVGRRAVVERCARVTCTLSGLDGIPVGKVDSLSSLSLMNAEPYVSFLLSAETAKTLPTAGQAFSLTFPTDDFAGIRTPSEPKLRVRIVQTMQILSPEGLDLIIVAAISEAIMGSCQTMRLTYNGKHYAQPISDWPTERSLATSSVIARTKEVLTRFPTGVWVIATDAADGTKCGLTVSSVASSATSPSILTFNLLQTSTFYASFCGVGTVVRTFLLAATQAALSDKYVKTCDVSAEDMTALCDHATLSLDAVVEQVSHVLDHLLVICRVRQVVAFAEGCRDCQSPLLRVDRAYTKLGRVGLEAASESFRSHVS